MFFGYFSLNYFTLPAVSQPEKEVVDVITAGKSEMD